MASPGPAVCANCGDPADTPCPTCDKMFCAVCSTVKLVNCPEHEHETGSSSSVDEEEAEEMAKINFLVQQDLPMLTEKTLALRAREGELTCDIDFSSIEERRMMGGMHVHIVLTFSDGVKWVARIPRLHEGGGNPVLVRQRMKSEAVVMQLLKSKHVPVPEVHGCIFDEDDEKLSYLLMDFVPGRDTFYEGMKDPKHRQKIVEQVADEMIAISTLEFPLVGAPLNTKGEIGPSVDEKHARYYENGELREQLGPFASIKEFRIAELNKTRERIARGRAYEQHAEEMFFILSQTLDMLELLYPAGSDRAPFFLQHVDHKGDQWLFDDDHNMTAVLDWESAWTTSMREAFVAPLAFIDVVSFFRGGNDLSAAEKDLAKALADKGRKDLSEYMRNGKAYQRLPFMAALSTLDNEHRNFFMALYRGVYAEREISWDQWLEKAKEQYGEELNDMRTLHQTSTIEQ